MHHVYQVQSGVCNDSRKLHSTCQGQCYFYYPQGAICCIAINNRNHQETAHTICKTIIPTYKQTITYCQIITAHSFKTPLAAVKN